MVNCLSSCNLPTTSHHTTITKEAPDRQRMAKGRSQYLTAFATQQCVEDTLASRWEAFFSCDSNPFPSHQPDTTAGRGVVLGTMSVRRALGVLSVKPGVCAVQVRRKVVGAVGKTQFVASADDADLLNAVYEAALRAREVAMERVKSAVLKENEEASASALRATEKAGKEKQQSLLREKKEKLRLRDKEKAASVRAKQKALLLQQKKTALLVKAKRKASLLKEKKQALSLKEKQKAASMREKKKTLLLKKMERSASLREKQKAASLKKKQKALLLKEKKHAASLRAKQKASLLKAKKTLLRVKVQRRAASLREKKRTLLLRAKARRSSLRAKQKALLVKAKEKAHKARVARLARSAAARERATRVREKKAALRIRVAERNAKKAEADKKAAALQVKREKKKVKALLASSGPVSAYNLFIQKTLKGTKGISAHRMKDVHTQWKALPAQQREVFEAEAAENKVKRAAIRESLKSLKKPTTHKYALFNRKHFAALHAAAKEQGLLEGLGPRERMTIMSRLVAQKYRAEQRAL